MRNGQRVHPLETLEVMRQRAANRLARLPQHLKILGPGAAPYRVEVTSALREAAATVDRATG